MEELRALKNNKLFKHKFLLFKMAKTKDVENKIRDLINWVQVQTLEELKAGEGRKIEEDTAKELQAKLREIAQLVGEIKVAAK